MTRNDIDAYDNIDAIRWSILKHARVSMLQYKHATDTPAEDNTRFIIGRAIHSAILEPDKIDAHYAVFDGARRAGKAWESFAAEHDGKTILKRDEWDAVMAAAERVAKSELASECLNRDLALIERPITWVDPFTKLACKARPDAVHSAIVEVKSTNTVDERDFIRNATRLGYFGQMAFYRRGYRELTKLWLPCFVLAVEVDAPHDIGVFAIDEDSLRVADDEITNLLAKVAECQKTGKWPGRYDTARPMVMPAWARAPEEFDFEDMEAA